MPNEHIRNGAVVKIYYTDQETERTRDIERNQLICCGTICKAVSDSELEIKINEAAFPELQKNICYLLHIYTPQNVYQCNVYYHSMYIEKTERILCLEIVSPLEKMQRRMHQRVSCHCKLRLRVIEKAKIKEFLENEDLQLFTKAEAPDDNAEDSMVDISGGGIRFTTGKKIPVDEYLSLQFEILSKETAKKLNVVGQVVYSAPLPNAPEYMDIRIKYIGISRQEREQIIRFVFQLERSGMKKKWS